VSGERRWLNIHIYNTERFIELYNDYGYIDYRYNDETQSSGMYWLIQWLEIHWRERQWLNTKARDSLSCTMTRDTMTIDTTMKHSHQRSVDLYND